MKYRLRICSDIGFEFWETIEGLEMYQVSTYGNVRSLKYNHKDEIHVLKQQSTKTGYRRIELYHDNTSDKYLVHRLVAATFLPNPNNYPEVNHKDECRTNNNVSNIEWCDSKYNANYGNRIQKIVNTRSMVVVQLSMDGEYIAEYKGQGDASRKTGISQTQISRVILGKRISAGGYKWIKK